MASKIFFQDESIQLLETASSQENISNVESSSPSILKIKRKKNKVHSPPPLSPNTSIASSENVADLFRARRKPLPPIPAPRKRVQNERKFSEITSDQSIQSPRSETISYKEQLRNRFRSVKKLAESSIIQTPTVTKKRSKSIDETILEKENQIIDNELKKREFKVDKGYDFFCNTHTEKNEESEVEKDIQEENNEPEVEKDSIVEFLGLDIPDTDVTENAIVEKINIAENEKELFWKPTGILTKYDDTKVRNLEEEGIFKPVEPNIPNSQLNLLKERLALDKNRDWFTEDGNLKILPDPRLNTCFKPFKISDIPKELTQGLQTIYIKPKVYEPIEDSEFPLNDIIEIQLFNIKFNHHALFSPEHVLAQKLQNLHEKFLEIKNSNKCLLLEKTIEALLTAKNRLKEAGDSNKIERYQNEIKETRIKMYEENKNYRELIKSMLCTWKAMKIVRSELNYVNTPLKLIIKKEYQDFSTEKEKWEKNIENEIEDTIEEHEKEFYEQIQKYKSELKEWKIQKRNIDDEDDLPEKPKKPQRNYDVEQIKKEITEKCQECLKHPGEPILDFDLIIDNDIITTDVVNPKELLRRAAVNKTIIFCKIFFDKQEICKSKLVNLNNFICEFDETFSIQCITKPKIFTLDFYEQRTISNKKHLYQINLLNKTDEDLQTENFTINEKIHSNHTGVGSNINTKTIFKNFNIEFSEEELCTSGTIKWNTININEKNETVNKTITNLKPKIQLKNIKELSQSFLDPLDPQNALIHEYVKNLNTKETTDYFRLNPGMEALQFCDISEIENNPRFRMLQLRDKNEPEFQGVVVPNRIKEISEDIFEAYEKRIAENNSSVAIEEFQKDNVDGQRKWGARYLQQAENKVIQLCKAAENKITLQDVLTEEPVPTLGSLGLTFLNWLQPNRPLRPVRKATKQSQTSVSIKDAKIIINIVGAMQIPIRRDTDMLTHNDQISVIPVRPFIIATFKDKQARTTVAEGANPIWNQELILSLDNLTETSIQNLKGTLYLHLYDEIVYNIVEDDRYRHTNIHQQLEYNWLGGINFPISTLMYNKRIEGTFKINSPPILLGYDNNTTQFYTDTVTHRQDTYLTIFVTMQPNLERKTIQPSLECNEMQYVEQHIQNWEEAYRRQFPNRYFNSLVVNINGETCCAMRYLKPITPPETDPDLEITEEYCARFVSMIPFKENNLYGKIPNIWLTPEELLKLSLGSITDHAILLACFFMSLEIKCWLILGYGIPYGYTAYVMTGEKNSLGHYVYFIYDVETAQKYSIQDNFCPLQQVFCAINDENIWGNIQIEERAHMSKYNFSKSSDWIPLFGRIVSAPIMAQKVSINYTEPFDIANLQIKIEKKLRQKVMKWRKHNVTIWNHYCSSILKEILPKLEMSFLMQENKKHSRHFEELHGLFNSYKMRGFAINFPYTSIKQISNYIRATRIHTYENPSTELSLGVYVHPYPNYVLVVWLYFATLVRRR